MARTVAKGTLRKARRQPGQAAKSVGKNKAEKNPLPLSGGSGSGEQGSNTNSGAGNAMLSGTPGGSGGEQGNPAGRTMTSVGRSA